ncbi:MAG: hypothetical protein RMJ54_18690 [Roseiflexaceae bacterium]|nr:hypothetical protein [Roseiflexaceae bacterium]
MSTIRVEAHVSTEQLLRAVEQLPEPDLDSFVAQVVMMRAQRAAPHLSHDETALLVQINRPLPPALQQRFDALVAKRQAETLTPAEHQELIDLTDQIEQHDAARLAALVQLAQLRQTSLQQLMQSLGIQSPTYA